MLWHLVISSAGRENLFPRREDRVALARRMVRVTREVLLFCAVDDHLHVVVEGEHLGRLGGALRGTLAKRARVQPAHFEPVEGRRHLIRLLAYLLRQPAKHELGVHPALWEGSCFADLVGARAIGFDRGPLERALPRLPHRDYLTPVELRVRPTPLAWEEVAAAGPGRMAGAISAAAGLDSLRGARTAERVAGRRTLAWMARRTGVSTATVATLLGLDARSARRLCPDEEPALVQVARTWLHLESLCGR